ncbi:MAG: hypothetical protein C4348_00465 [Patescibacteria group bacterium]
MNKTSIITVILFFLISVFGLIFLGFWKAGIFKKEYEPSPILQKIQSQLNFIKDYNFQKGNEALKNLGTIIKPFPQISEVDLGRPSLFSNPQ